MSARALAAAVLLLAALARADEVPAPLQAQLLAVADVFWLLLILFCSTLLLLPLLRRVRVGPARTAAAREDVHAALPVE